MTTMTETVRHYSALRTSGRFFGTISRAKSLRKSRISASSRRDQLAELRASRPTRAACLRAKKSAAIHPTPAQAIALANEIHEALDAVQGRCSQRCLVPQHVVNVGRNPGTSERPSRPSGSYGYAYTITRAWSAGSLEGYDRRVTVHRKDTVHIDAPDGHWANISLATQVLEGGGYVAIRRRRVKNIWDCYDRDGTYAGVCVRTASASGGDVWRHSRRPPRRAKKRLDRMSRMLAVIGHRTMVDRATVHAAGACMAGIQAYATRHGVADDATLPITALPAEWRQRVARVVLARQQSV